MATELKDDTAINELQEKMELRIAKKFLLAKYPELLIKYPSLSKRCSDLQKRISIEEYVELLENNLAYREDFFANEDTTLILNTREEGSDFEKSGYVKETSFYGITSKYELQIKKVLSSIDINLVHEILKQNTDKVCLLVNNNMTNMIDFCSSMNESLTNKSEEKSPERFIPQMTEFSVRGLSVRENLKEIELLQAENEIIDTILKERGLEEQSGLVPG